MWALSLRQPWLWAILDLPPELRKDVENRSWHSRFRGKVLLHASKTCTYREWIEARAFIWSIADRMCPGRQRLPMGGIVGWVEILGCVNQCASPWFGGPWGYLLGVRGKIEPMIECPGQRGFFRVPEDVATRVKDWAAENASEQNRVGKCLRRAGWVRQQYRVPGTDRRDRRYVKPTSPVVARDGDADGDTHSNVETPALPSVSPSSPSVHAKSVRSDDSGASSRTALSDGDNGDGLPTLQDSRGTWPKNQETSR